MKNRFIDWLSNFSWEKIRSGRTITQLLRNAAGEIVLIVVCMIFLIHNQYVCNDYISQLAVCERKLTNYKFEALTKKSQMTKKIQQSHVKHLIEVKGIPLEDSTYPPYVLKK